MSGTVARRANNLHRNITVTPFLNKLYSMVDDTDSDNLIKWSDDGNSFVVIRHEEFAKEVLPRFFKHSNFSSFVRQLNMYGFHKVPHLQQGGLISDGPDAESWEFNNDNFQRGQPDLLHFIRRKKGNRDVGGGGVVSLEQGVGTGDEDTDEETAAHVTAITAAATGAASAVKGPAGNLLKSGAANTSGETTTTTAAAATAAATAAAAATKTRASRTPPVNLARILKEIQVIRDHQLTISSDIKRLQEENQSMWMHVGESDERYKRQQDTIDKILQFLASVFSADSRHSEIQIPLRRLISHDSTEFSKSNDSTGIGSNSSNSSSNVGIGSGGSVGARTSTRTTYKQPRPQQQQQQQQQQSNQQKQQQQQQHQHQQQHKQQQQQQQQQQRHLYQHLGSLGHLSLAKPRNSMATPRTHAIFEEMDFPDAFSNNTAQHQPPPEKRQRTNSMSERFFEIPTGSTSSSPAESTGQRTPRKTSAAMNKAPGAAAAAAGGKSAEVKRKVPAAAAAASNGSGSQMMSSNGSMVGRLTSNSKSLERMGQESEYAGLSIENLMRMFTPSQQGQQQQHNQQQGQGDISVDYLPLSTSNATKLADFLPPASGIPTHTNVAGSMAVGDSAAAHSQAIGFPVHGSESTDQLAHLLSADDFNNLTMLSNSGVAAAGEAAVPPVGSGANLAANMFDGAGLASLFEYMANQPAAAAATNMHVGIGGGGGGGDAYESSFMGNVSGGGSGQAYGTQWLVDALKSLTPEQQQSMYNYYKNAGHVNHVPLLTAESQDSMDIGSGADGSSFLEFVDPNAENIEGGSGGSSSSSVGAVGDLGIADISSSVSTSGMGSAEDDYGILFKEALGSDIVGLPGVHAADSASTDAAGSVVDVSGIHPDLAATLFHTSPVVAPTSDVLDMLNSPGLSLVATSSVQSEPSDM